MRSARPWLAAAAAAALLTGPAVSQDRYNSADYQNVAHSLQCQCGGCNALVAECAMDRCPSSEPIREEIAERLQAGETAEEVIGRFVERYGLVILSAPPTTGFYLSAWLLPGVFLLGGVGLAAVVLHRWRKTSPAAAVPEDSKAQPGSPAPVTPVKVSPDVLARIERDVEEIR